MADNDRERAHKAKQLLDNPLWAEAWTALETGLTQSWQNTQRSDSVRRENIYFQLDAARAVKRHFEQILLTGQMIEMQESTNVRGD